jgi:hypothetical protein
MAESYETRVKIETLTGSNYKYWRRLVFNILIQWHCKNLILSPKERADLQAKGKSVEGVTNPVDDDEEELKEAKVQNLLLSTVSRSIYSRISHLGLVWEIWKKLRDEFELPGVYRLDELFGKFWLYKMGADDTIVGAYTRLTALQAEIREFNAAEAPTDAQLRFRLFHAIQEHDARFEPTLLHLQVIRPKR